MNAPNLWDLGYLLAGLLVALFVWRAQSHNQPIKALSAVSIGFLVAIFTLLLYVRFAVIPDMKGAQATALTMQSTPGAERFLEHYVEAYEKTDESRFEIMRDFFEERRREYDAYLNDASKGIYVIEKADLIRFSTELISDTRVELIATSYVNPDRWWKGNEGERYVQANLALAKRGVRIQRFFIFADDAEFRQVEDVIRRQVEGGIPIFIILRDKVDYEHQRDLIVIDNQIAGELILTPEREPVRAIMFTDNDAIQRVRTRLENLSSIAKPAQDLLSGAPQDGGSEHAR